MVATKEEAFKLFVIELTRDMKCSELQEKVSSFLSKSGNRKCIKIVDVLGRFNRQVNGSPQCAVVWQWYPDIPYLLAIEYSESDSVYGTTHEDIMDDVKEIWETFYE